MTRDSTDAVLALASALAETSRLVEDDAYEETAQRFVDHLTRSVPGCDLAFLAVGDGEGFEVVATTDQPPVGQAATGPDDSGPIGEVLRYREPRRVEDSRDHGRWHLFSARLALHGFRGCLVLPVPTERSPTAALTLLSRTPHQFDEHTYDIILLITLHAGTAFDNAQLFHDSRRMVHNLTTALSTRHTIGVAQGLLMRHLTCDTDGAFTLLRRASQHTNHKLRDLAARLVTAHEQGNFHEALVDHRIHQDVQ